MSVGSKVIANILDVIFGNTFIATIYDSDKFFNLIFDLIILACYIYLFKHFCSFLTNMLTSLLNFNGQGFTRSTSDESYGDRKAIGIGFFGSGNIANQFINATNYKTIEKETKDFVKRTAGFRTIDKYTGISNFSVLDGGKFSLKKAFSSSLSIIKRTTGSIYDQTIGNDLKKFVEIRKIKREKEPATIESLDEVVKDERIQNLIEQMNNDKLDQNERNTYKTRFDTMINENIKRNLNKYKLSNDKTEFEKNLNLAVERGLITEDERSNALDGENLSLDDTETDTINTNYTFKKGLHHNAKLSPVGLGRSAVNFIEKSLLLNSITGTNRKQNLINISRLAKMSKRGYFDMSVIGAEKMDMDKLINGSISTKDYKEIMKHIKAIGFNTTEYSAKGQIKKNLIENEHIIRKTNYNADKLREFINISKDKVVVERIAERESVRNFANYLKKLKEKIADDITNSYAKEGTLYPHVCKIEADNREIDIAKLSLPESKDKLKRKLTDDIKGIKFVDTDKKIKSKDTNEEDSSKIVIGYTDNSVLYIDSNVKKLGACVGYSELIESLKNDEIDIGAATEKILEEKNNMSESEEQIIKHSEALIKINNLKMKLVEYNIQVNDESVNELERLDELKEKTKKLKKRIKDIEKKKEK